MKVEKLKFILCYVHIIVEFVLHKLCMTIVFSVKCPGIM